MANKDISEVLLSLQERLRLLTAMYIVISFFSPRVILPCGCQQFREICQIVIYVRCCLDSVRAEATDCNVVWCFNLKRYAYSFNMYNAYRIHVAEVQKQVELWFICFYEAEVYVFWW